MSIASPTTARRLLGTGAAALALCAASVAGASGAWAHETPGGDGWKSGGTYKPGTGAGTETGTDRCEFSLDGTAFFSSVKVDDQNLRPTADGQVHITVRAAGGASTCTASLASYLAHGATFASSGKQVFVGFDTVTVKPGATDTLDIAVPDAGCFAQVDLYRGAVKFDGKLDAQDGSEHGNLPEGPNGAVIKDKLIAAWNGGTKDCTTGTSTSTPTTTPATTPAGTETTPASSTETTPAADESTPAADESTPAADESAAGADASESATDTAAAAATPDGGSKDLAETGGGSNTGVIAGGAAALLVGGAAIVMATKRRRTARS
ncbi:LAETG motif-containing sortase-dependent surface protein [Streptomyces sp. NPDC001443]